MGRQTFVQGGRSGRLSEGPDGQLERGATRGAPRSSRDIVQAAAEAVPRFPDGAWLCELAAIATGLEVALLVNTPGPTPPQVVPLAAGEDVGCAGFFTRIWIGLKSLFGMA